MSKFLETYGTAIFTLVLVAILIAFAGPLGMKIKNATTEKVSTTEEIGCDEVYVATTGRSKPPTTVDDKVWIYIDKNNELVISKNKITAPTDALLKEKEINVQGNGLASTGSFEEKLVKTVKFAEKIRPKTCHRWFADFNNLTEVKNIENLYTDQCINMFFMFYRCSSLKEINLKYFNTSNVTDMRCMFMGCSSLKYLDLSSFDISKSKDCNYMMDTNTSTTIKANSDLKAKFNRMSSETKITWE